MRSIRNNKEMVSSLLADYKFQENEINKDYDNDESNVSPTPYKTIYENKYDNRFESNEIKR